jgi:hypothetical protein
LKRTIVLSTLQTLRAVVRNEIVDFDKVTLNVLQRLQEQSAYIKVVAPGTAAPGAALDMPKSQPAGRPPKKRYIFLLVSFLVGQRFLIGPFFI